MSLLLGMTVFPKLRHTSLFPLTNNYLRLHTSIRVASMSTTSKDPPTVGVIVIGDEILKGRTQDSNSYFMTQRLNKLGLSVQKISVIPDQVSDISKEVKLFSSLYDHVITSGGIGPTHDDVTLEGVAEAFGDKLEAHPDLVDFIGNYFKTKDIESPAMKMAHIPTTSVLVYPEDKSSGYKSLYPVITVKNVVILPGIPKLLEKAFRFLDKQLFGEHCPLPYSELYLTVDEVTMAPALNETVAHYQSLTIGSYPQLFHSYYITKITIEGKDEMEVREAREQFKKNLPQGSVLEDYVTDTTASSWGRMQNLLGKKDPKLEEPVRKSIGVLEQCLTKYKPNEITVCFNGGKDCLAVLHLYHALLHRDDSSKIEEKIQALYITEEKTFPEMSQFVRHTINRYDLDCTILKGPLKAALLQLRTDKPNIKAVIMGTRRMDPYSDGLHFFQMTDGDWPEYDRVNPILDWDYGTVWSFIRGLYLPYCDLYDRGYTSMGNAENTLPNPQLQTTDRLGNITYLPAYKLQDGTKERCGRK